MRILLADEQSLFREAVRFALSRAQDMEVVAEPNDAAAAIREAQRTRPDVAFVDVGLPAGGGIEVTRKILGSVPDCRVIVVSPKEDERTLMEAVMAGASGYLTRRAHLVELLDAARSVHRGEAVIPPTLLRWLLSQLVGLRREGNEALAARPSFSDRAAPGGLDKADGDLEFVVQLAAEEVADP